MADIHKQGLGITEVIGNKRDDILQLARDHKAYNIRIFGSVARGEATDQSDIDFLVDFQPDYRLFDHIGLKQSLEDLLGRKVDVAIERLLRDEFRPYVMRDAVAL